jgi:hypothetical protein
MTMTKLHHQRVEVAEWLVSVKSSSATAWSSKIDGFSAAYVELFEAWQDAVAEFDS